MIAFVTKQSAKSFFLKRFDFIYLRNKDFSNKYFKKIPQ